MSSTISTSNTVPSTTPKQKEKGAMLAHLEQAFKNEFSIVEKAVLTEFIKVFLPGIETKVDKLMEELVTYLQNRLDSLSTQPSNSTGPTTNSAPVAPNTV